MNCQICEKDIGDVIVLIPLKRPGGYLESLVCLSCASNSGMYCGKHNMPHMGFIDGTSACRHCIRELALSNAYWMKTFLAILDIFATKDMRELREERCYAHLSEVENDFQLFSFFAGLSLSMKIDFEAIIHVVVSEGSLDFFKLRAPAF